MPRACFTCSFARSRVRLAPVLAKVQIWTLERLQYTRALAAPVRAAKRFCNDRDCFAPPARARRSTARRPVALLLYLCHYVAAGRTCSRLRLFRLSLLPTSVYARAIFSGAYILSADYTPVKIRFVFVDEPVPAHFSRSIKASTRGFLPHDYRIFAVSSRVLHQTYKSHFNSPSHDNNLRKSRPVL